MKIHSPALLVILCFVVLAFLLAHVRPAQSDEGHHASAAYLFATTGALGMPMQTSWMPSLDRRLYAVMPLYFPVLSGWFGLWGTDILTMRYFSILWGAVSLGAWYAILRLLFPRGSMALLGLIVIGINYDFINLNSARYDPMAAALNVSGAAVYLTLRTRSFGWAILAGNTLAAAACLTHPYGVFGVVGLLVYVFGLDRSRIRWRHLALIAVPYLAAAAAWGLYILQDIPAFREQLGRNVQGRAGAWRHPAQALYAEVKIRYLELFAGWRPDAPVYMRVKVLLLVLFSAAYAWCWQSRPIRSDPLRLATLLYASIAPFLLAFFEGTRWYVYLIHVLPLCAVVLVLWMGEWRKQSGIRRRLVPAAAACLALFAIVSILYRVRLDVHGSVYAPTAAYLRQHVRHGQFVFGPAELGFVLGFHERLQEDEALGYTSGKTADYIVLNEALAASLDASRTTNGGMYERNVRMLADEYRVVFEAARGGKFYRVFARRDGRERSGRDG